MPFTFVHTADWQVGKSFGRFDSAVAVQLRAARLDGIDRLATVARGAGASHVLVAGDVIDSELIDDAQLRQPLARMSAYPEVTWHLLPGNHDPARAGGVWERLKAFGLPANAIPHLEPRPSEIAPGIFLLPAPLAAKETHTDPTRWMDEAPTPEGAVRIGVAHGSVQGFGSLGEAAVPIDARRRQSAGLDYLALGDWHGVKEVASGVWYAGTPEPDSFMDNGPGHALVVRIDGPRALPAVTKVATATFQWLARRVRLARLADIDPVIADVASGGGARRHRLVALDIEGSLGAAEASRLDERLAELRAMLLALEVDRRRLRIAIGDGDLASFDDPVLGRVAARLAERARDPSGEGAAIAARAFGLLLALDSARTKTEEEAA